MDRISPTRSMGRTPDTRYALAEGTLLSLAPGVPHDVVATTEADMLLGIYPER